MCALWAHRRRPRLLGVSASLPCALLDDARHEAQIQRTFARMLAAHRQQRRREWEELRRLVLGRSPAQVARMEREQRLVVRGR